MLLESRGHEVVLTTDGEMCIEAFKATKDPFAIVVLDYRMPRKDGIAVAQEIQTINPAQKIIIASAYVKDVMDKASRNLTYPVAFIEKPVDLDSFGELVERQIKSDSTFA